MATMDFRPPVESMDDIRLLWREKEFQSALLEAYVGSERHPVTDPWVAHHTFFSKNSMAGWPDIVLLRRERMVICELKSETGKLSAEQVACIDALLRVQAALVAMYHDALQCDRLPEL